MQENVADALAFTFMVVLPVGAWVLSRPSVWRWLRAMLGPWLVRLWQQLATVEEPDEQQLRRWAALRLEQLQEHLERVRRLISDDGWMTATRQTANRIAYEHLVRDVRTAEAEVAAYGPEWGFDDGAAPTPRALPRLSFAPAPAARTAEVMEFGPSGRWL